MSWWDRAACVGADAELFFPLGDGPATKHTLNEAKAVCNGCPVVSECLTWAMSMDVTGVWGGLSDRERRDLRKRRVHVEHAHR